MSSRNKSNNLFSIVALCFIFIVGYFVFSTFTYQPRANKIQSILENTTVDKIEKNIVNSYF